MLCFSLAAFRILSLTFATFIIICLGVGLFGFNLFGPLCAYFILISVSFRFAKFSAIISSNIVSIPFLFLHLLGSLLCIDWPTLYFPIDLLYCFHVFSFGFLSWLRPQEKQSLNTGEDERRRVGPLFYLPSHLFVPLQYLFCSSMPLTQLVTLQMNFLTFICSSIYFLFPF